MVFVIPAKAGIQMIEAKPATRNQVQIASDKSLPPLRGKARMGERRAQAWLCGRDARAPRCVKLPLSAHKGGRDPLVAVHT